MFVFFPDELCKRKILPDGSVSLGLGFGIHDEYGRRWKLPRKVVLKRPTRFFRSDSHHSFRVKLTPKEWSKQRLHNYSGRKVLDFENALTMCVAIADVRLHWMTTVVYDARGADHDNLKENPRAREEGDHYKIKKTQYVISHLAFYSAEDASRGFFLLM